ncbi:MAG: hypothetical protein OHK0046_35700 [Anaerolineae bacterium]
MTLIAITGAPPWLAQITADYRQYHDREHYIAQLADDRIALILVDGTQPDWAFWAVNPKISPATRRIPVFVVSDSDAVQAQARQSGADLALTSADLLQNFEQYMAAFARITDPELAARLECECQEPLPELAQQGVEKFNAGEFYQQHDLFEALWVETEGPVRDLYRAILQVGVAYYQILRGNPRGAHKMLLRSVQWLALLPDHCQGIDVQALREDSARVRVALEQLPPEKIDQFDRNLLKPVKNSINP